MSLRAKRAGSIGRGAFADTLAGMPASDASEALPTRLSTLLGLPDKVRPRLKPFGWSETWPHR